MCHGPDGDFPLDDVIRGRDAATLYEQIGKLPELNEMMPEFEGTDEERQNLSRYLEQLARDEGATP